MILRADSPEHFLFWNILLKNSVKPSYFENASQAPLMD
jgi:hypothetical protein